MNEAKGKVAIAWMFNEDIKGWTTFSLVDLVHWDAYHDQYIGFPPEGGTITLSTGPRVAEGRNSVVDIFATKHPEADWLLMLDADMTFSPDLLHKLMKEADPTESPVIGGLCFAGGRENKPYPTVYSAQQKDGYYSVERVYDYPRNAMVRVAATGGACLLVHRQVLAAMKKAYGETQSGAPSIYPWFIEGLQGPEGEAWGEDVAFCLRAGALGIPVWVHTGVKLGHIKPQIIDETYFDNYNRSAELTKQGAFDGNGFTNPGGHNGRAQRRAKARQLAKEKS